jgi:hypothetical protein
MSSHNRGGYGHHIRRLSADHFIISWCWDKHYDGQRCRYPQSIKRHTDEAGARRFCKRWNLTMPEVPHA